VFPHEYRRVLAEQQAKISRHGSFTVEYKEEDIISQELLRKEAVRVLLSLCTCLCPCVCLCISVEC